MAFRPVVPVNTGFSVGPSTLPAQSRSVRRPRHEAQFRIPPFCLFPFLWHPVIPGDTVVGAQLLGRVVTDPVDGKLLPWWLDIFWFYCPWRATAAADALQSMALGNHAFDGTDFMFNGGTIAPTVSGSGYFTQRLNGQPDFGKLAYNAIVQEFFRDEGDDAADFVHALSGMALMKNGRTDWFDSLVPTSTITGVDPAVDIDSSGTIYASEVEQAMRSWQILRQGQLTEMTFEDYLGTFGVRVTPAQREIVPELLEHRRMFEYPSNTVTQGTGAVTSAVVWSINHTLKSRKLIREPGWIVGMMCVRPKVYRKRQVGAAINLMTNGFHWLPRVLDQDPSTSLIAMDTVSGAIGSATGNGGLFTMDIRDLFVHGDQVVYASPSVAGGDSVAAGGVAMANIGTAEVTKLPIAVSPDVSGDPRYTGLTLADLAPFFAGTTNEASLVQGECSQRLDIVSTVLDLTPGVPRREL